MWTQSVAQPGIYSEADIVFQTLFIDAQLAKQKGDTEEQISLLKKVLKRNKTSHAAYFELAKTYVDLEDYDAAEKNAKKAIQFDANNEYYLSLVGDIYERSEQFQKAIQTFSQLIGLDANNLVYYDKKAFCQIVVGEPQNAISTLELWQSKKGITPIVSSKIFDIYNGLGDSENAKKTLNILTARFPSNIAFLNKEAKYLQFIGESDQALKIYKKILELDSTNQDAQLALSQQNIKTNSSSTGLDALEELIANTNISLDSKVKELMPLILRMSEDKMNHKSLQNISQKLVDNYPNEAKAYVVRGDILFYSQEYKSSEIAYSKAIKLDDRKYVVWDQWMINLWELESFKKLEDVSLEAIDFYPNQVEAYIFNVLALNKNNNISEAKDMLEEASFISGENPKYSDALKVIESWIDINDLSAEQIQNNIKAIKDINLGNQVYFEILGDLYAHISDEVKSKSYWKKAILLGANAKRLNKKIGV